MRQKDCRKRNPSQKKRLPFTNKRCQREPAWSLPCGNVLVKKHNLWLSINPFVFRFDWYIVRVTTTTASLWKCVSTKFTRQIAVPTESPDRHRITNLFDTGWNLTNHITKSANIPGNACGLQVQCERCFFLVTITRESRKSRCLSRNNLRVSRATDSTPFGCALHIK